MCSCRKKSITRYRWGWKGRDFSSRLILPFATGLKAKERKEIGKHGPYKEEECPIRCIQYVHSLLPCTTLPQSIDLPGFSRDIFCSPRVPRAHVPSYVRTRTLYLPFTTSQLASSHLLTTFAKPNPLVRQPNKLKVKQIDT